MQHPRRAKNIALQEGAAPLFNSLLRRYVSLSLRLRECVPVGIGTVHVKTKENRGKGRGIKQNENAIVAIVEVHGSFEGHAGGPSCPS